MRAPVDEPESPATPPKPNVAPVMRSAIPWQWDDAPDLFPALDLVHGDFVVTQVGDTTQLHGPGWSVDVDKAGDDIAGALLAVDNGRIFVATYNRIAAGCRLSAFDTSGKPLWTLILDGIGPIAHSKYSNRVQMRMIGGDPVVFGSEAKRYIEERDAATGALVSHQLFDAQRAPRPIAEDLYHELDHRLASADTARVAVNDFLRRHVAMTDADHATRGAAFGKAVQQIDGLAIRRGAFRLRLQLTDTKDDFTIAASRAR